MADILNMKRKTTSKWLSGATLLAALLLPLTALGEKSVIVIVGAEDRAKQAPVSETHPESGAEQIIVDEESAATQVNRRPDIDIFTPRKDKLEFVTLNSVLFSHNGTALDGQAKRVLDDVAAYLHNNNSIERLLINGFADKTASSDYNAKLSAKRAFVVHEYLRHQGVSPTLLHTVSWGEGHPADEHWTINGRKRNRRVELYLVQKPTTM